MDKSIIVAGNWKMHKTVQESVAFVKNFLPLLAPPTCKVLLAPPFTALFACSRLAEHSALLLGAQNISEHQEGAFTGEISAKMVKEAGAKFVILGHSERRTHFQESNAVIHQKIQRAIELDLLPILCIGETAKEREEGLSHQVWKKQLDECLQGYEPKKLEKLVIAYEPVWAIGTGKSATEQIAQEAHARIRLHLAEKMGQVFAANLFILYGGSVNLHNIDSLLKQKDINGVLVGGAALDLETFTKMVRR